MIAFGSGAETESSSSIRDRVMKARELQVNRYDGVHGVYANGQMNKRQLAEYCELGDSGRALLKQAMERLNLSARAYDRILKVSRTIADLGNSDKIMTEHLAEAIQFRSLDRESWGE